MQIDTVQDSLAEKFIATFWGKSGNITDKNYKDALNNILKSTLYDLGIIKVRALEDLEGLVTVGKIYTVNLVKDEDFSEGEEYIIGDNGELVTLLCFKREELVW
jgi:hypothetical protein